MSRRNLGSKIKLASYDDMFGTMEDTIGQVGQKEEGQVITVPVDQLHMFENHPFKVVDDEYMEEMIQSIKLHGVLVPLMARPKKTGGYELLSGHRRHHAAVLAGLEGVPVMVKDCTDDEATIVMVDSNIQRERIAISEKAKAYHMKYEAMKHQGKAGGISLDEMSEETGENRKTIQRLIRLSFLTDEFLEMIDMKKLGICQGIEISYLPKEQQEMVFKNLSGHSLSIEQAQAIRLAQAKGDLTQEYVVNLFKEHKEKVRKVTFSFSKLDDYFAPDISNEMIEEIIISLLKEWKEKGGTV